MKCVSTLSSKWYGVSSSCKIHVTLNFLCVHLFLTYAHLSRVHCVSQIVFILFLFLFFILWRSKCLKPKWLLSGVYELNQQLAHCMSTNYHNNSYSKISYIHCFEIKMAGKTKWSEILPKKVNTLYAQRYASRRQIRLSKCTRTLYSNSLYSIHVPFSITLTLDVKLRY